MSIPTELTFNERPMHIVKRRDGDWVRASELALALGYKQGVRQTDAPLRSVMRLYTRNKDEFTSSMSRMIKLQTAGGHQTVRAFSLRGAHLLAMFSKTEKAKEFRCWVLDIIENEAREQKRQQQEIEQRPQVENKYVVLERDELGMVREQIADLNDRIEELNAIDRRAPGGHSLFKRVQKEALETGRAIWLRMLELTQPAAAKFLKEHDAKKALPSAPQTELAV